MTREEKIKVWVEALRSGKYKQVQGTLKGLTEDEDVGFCCLGVYNDLFKVGPMRVEVEPEDKRLGYLEEGPTETYASIVKEIKGYLYDAGVDMNDSGYSFDGIADKIEELEQQAADEQEAQEQ